MQIMMAQGVAGDLKKLGNDDRREVITTIKNQLSKNPGTPTEHRLEIEKHLLPWGDADPIWQFRAGKNRIYYEYEQKTGDIVILAIWQKPLQPRI